MPETNNSQTVDFSGIILRKTGSGQSGISKGGVFSNNKENGSGENKKKLLLLGGAIVLIIVAIFFLGNKNNQAAKIEAPPGSKVIYSKEAPPRLEKLSR